MVIKVRIEIPVFRSSVSVVIGDCINPFGRINDNFAVEYMARCVPIFSDSGTRILIHSRTCALSVIAHEAVHAASFILGHIGHKADFDNDEVQAYLIQYIVERVERKIYG